MNSLIIVHAGAVLLTITLGTLVLRTNPRRATNQIFALLSFALGLWLICMAIAFSATNTRVATAFIRGCHGIGITFPFLFDSLRRSIVSRSSNLWFVARQSPVWLVTTLVMAGLSLTPWIVEGSYCPDHTSILVSIPEPIFGLFFGGYVTYYASAVGVLIYRFRRSFKSTSGIQRAELNFTLVGAAGSIMVGVSLAIIPPLITGSSQSAQFTSLGVIVLDSIIAFGIATRRIMDMAYLFRLVTSYGLLTAYLGSLYLAVLWPTISLTHRLGISPGPLPHFLAALAVAFSLAPMNGVMQRFANRVFINDAPLNMESVVQLANQLLRSISTVDQLLSDFADTITKAVGTDRIIILLAKNHQYSQRYQSHGTFPQLAFAQHDVLPQALIETAAAIVPDILRRLRPSARLAEACTVIEQHKLSIAIGLRAKEGLEGILLLGPKLSGRIYGAPEQHALQLLCNQLAIALNNARLYTQVQDAKIYNDMLVDNLASGVIAADSAGRVTVFNREAQRITQRDTASILGQPSTVLPDMLAALLSSTLTQGQGQRDQDMVLARPSNGEGTPIRVSSSVFFSHTGEILGAFLVINDLTTIKQLELQVRRTDRLASLGTLAAGMAHEIKNPLVSIKTFTQLLPERYGDDDFRQTFFSLVGGEVKRIDRIVNQLLRFSRPAKPNLTATRLHEVIDSALKLMTQQLRQKNISLTLSLDASSDSIRADGDQLSQALINLFLNAIEAMADGGRLTVRTNGVNPNGFSNAFTSERLAPPQIEVTIQDTGEGIPAEKITHIFDPFFTTKDQGTGLGLSVAHGIVHDHNGVIDVKSEPGQGTTFTILFPLIQEDRPS